MTLQLYGERVAEAILACLTPGLLSREWRRRARSSDSSVAGHCYVASEALYYLCGERDLHLQPHRVEHENASHWYLVDSRTGRVVDLTADQFATPVPYERGKPAAFLTRQPSARARTLIGRVRLKLTENG